MIESIFGIALLISVGLLVNTGVPASEAQNQVQATTNTTAIQNENYLNSRLLIIILKLVCPLLLLKLAITISRCHFRI